MLDLHTDLVVHIVPYTRDILERKVLLVLIWNHFSIFVIEYEYGRTSEMITYALIFDLMLFYVGQWEDLISALLTRGIHFTACYVMRYFSSLNMKKFNS